MSYKDCDIVYILKDGIDPAELTQSLRSIDKNFPHRKVWFVGAQPEGLTPDLRLPHKQSGSNKWERVCSSYLKICNNPTISENFFLFNDDFFVLKRIDRDDEFINFVDGTLENKVRKLTSNLNGSSTYSKKLADLSIYLKMKNLDTMNFALHLPFLYNKSLIKKTLNEFPNTPMFRSAYGNLNDVPYKSHKDIKIYDRITIPSENWDYVSTTEETFARGKVGEYIRNLFPEPSRFEAGYYNNKVKELQTEEGEERYHVL